VICFGILKDGWCSFCGNDRGQFRVLIASPLREVAICDRCTVLACDILGESLAAQRRCNPSVHIPPHYYDSEFLERVDLLVRGLERERTPRSEPPDDRCSFCDATRHQAADLVSGPQVFVCERCVGSCCRLIALGPTAGDLDEALVAAFPVVTIDRAMIEEASAVWDAYLEYDELTLFEGRTWRELPSSLLLDHSSLLGCWRSVTCSRSWQPSLRSGK
jgi:hypothetical protein